MKKAVLAVILLFAYKNISYACTECPACQQTCADVEECKVIKSCKLENLYDDKTDCSGHKRFICHIPPSNSENMSTLCVDCSAISTHLAHGDYLGVCTKKVCSYKNHCEKIKKCKCASDKKCVSGQNVKYDSENTKLDSRVTIILNTENAKLDGGIVSKLDMEPIKINNDIGVKIGSGIISKSDTGNSKLDSGIIVKSDIGNHKPDSKIIMKYDIEKSNIDSKTNTSDSENCNCLYSVGENSLTNKEESDPTGRIDIVTRGCSFSGEGGDGGLISMFIICFMLLFIKKIKF
jgi:hypothetical protein